MGGHSFGGMTAIAVSEKDDRVKATFGFDAWTWCVNSRIEEGDFKLSQPQIHIITENFIPTLAKVYEYSQLEKTKKMMQDSSSPMKELIVLNETNHGHQCDVLVLIPLEAFLMTMDSFQLNYVELYLLNT